MRKNTAKLHDIILSGGPPWGFTLAGGSEFGSILCVSKVTDDRKAVYGSLHTGDQILSVNGVSCTSRVNAIQMVRTIDDELRLKICRPNNVVGRKTVETLNENIQDNEPQVIVERNMNEVSNSLSNLRQNSVNNPPWNYKIISINKDQKTNQHSIRIGIDDTLVRKSENVDICHGSDSDYNNNDGTPAKIPYQINPTSASTPQQKITVKMMPSSQGASGSKITKSGARQYSLEESTLVCPSPIEENVDVEPCQSVSTARALFEKMSSSSERLKNIKEKSHLKSWNSSSLLDNCETDKANLSSAAKSTKLHEHSKSLPVDIAAKEYEKHIHSRHPSGVTATSITINYKQNKDNINENRPKSAFLYEESRKRLPSDPFSISNNSNNNINTTYHHHASGSEIITSSIDRNLKEQMSSLPSYSSEDLRYKNETRSRTSTSGSKNDSANELRLAASRYHEELMKNYPKFRNTITGKDNALKFTARKASMPTEEPFTRGSMRATIATTTMANRSFSTNDTLEIQDLNEVLSKTSEDSMMQRLLRDQSNTNNLMKIDEEVKSNAGNIKVVIRRNSLDGSEPNTADFNRRSSDKKRYNDFNSKSTSFSNDSPTDQDSTERFTEQLRGNRFAGSKSTSSIVPEMKSISIQTDDEDSSRKSSTDSLNGDHLKMKQPTSNVIDKLPKKEVEESKITNLSVEPVECVRNTNIDLKQTSYDSSSSGSTILGSPYAVETDIDAVEASEIVHRKDHSTDSAVYVTEDQISHARALSNVSTDSLSEYPDIPYKQYEEILPYDYHGEDGNEKEKPQRTINRRKKDSSHANSRNNSCVSTDSTTSTATYDSGIVVQSDSSQRASPMSNDSSYYKDLNGSRETLDDDVAALSDESRIMSTPERHEEAKNAGYQLLGQSYGSSLNQSPLSSGENSRRDSLHSPRPGDLDSEKAKLVTSMREKINDLREEEQIIANEIRMNEELGKKVLSMVKVKATQTEFSKFELFIGELNKIVALLLSLTQRLHRHELTLLDLDMANDADKEKKESLIAKIDKLKSQHEEACYLRDVNDKRGEAVASFLEKYCTVEEFADFEHYVEMKSQLSLMQSKIREKVKLGEERLKALELMNSEWGYK